MIVERVEMRGFMRYAEQVVEFPERGVMLVRGHNGAGKSTVVEAVSFALWGKTLRGTSPWSGDAGQVIVDVRVGDRAIRVVRAHRKGKSSLSWQEEGTSGTVYESNTKSQEALETIVGDWDLWRRAFVFSSADAAHFSLATDADRKRLLESVLGLDRFDTALDACRADLRAAELSLSKAERNAAVDLSALGMAERSAKESRETLASLTDPGPVPDVAALQTSMVDMSAEYKSLEAELMKVTSDVATSRARLDEARRALGRVSRSACPSCTQPIPEEMRARAAAEAASAEDSAASLAAQSKQVAAEIEMARNDLAHEIASLRTRIIEAGKIAAHARITAKLRADLLARINSADAEIERCSRDFAESSKTAEVERARVGVLSVAAQVLSTKGVRAHVLGEALDGLEANANSWLSRIAPSVSVEIAASREKKTGGTINALTLAVRGVGNGSDYRATSGGERRRVDVAMVLALGEVAAAAHGRAGGTLFADEVFDALDPDGCERVAAALEELAEERAVFLVTHSDHVAASVRPRTRLFAHEGRLEVS